MIKEKLIWLLDKILDLIYPPDLYCICCGNYIDDTRTYHLCDHCISHMHWNLEPPKDKDGIKMMKCTEYGLYERTIIFSMKYNGRSYVCREIGEIMRDKITLTGVDFDIIVPVPMYYKKQRKRGFNQAALISLELGKLIAKPCYENALIRTSDTRTMRGLKPAERAANIQGKFAVKESFDKLLQGKRVLLVDDFYTTGSTARECAKMLQSSGAKEVVVLAFAAR